MMNRLKMLLKCIHKHLFFIFLLCFSLHLPAATEFKIISLQHRLAEDILPAIKPLVGNDGTVTAMQNNLIIRASSENMAQIEQVIATLDTARQNLKITISRQSNLASSNSQAEVSGRKRIGNITAGTRNYPAKARDGVQINIENNQNTSSNNSNQFINVLDGERAFIVVGQSIPYTQEWVTLTRRYVTIQRTTEFIEINTGFTVRPRSIGNQIELEVTPRFSQLNQDGFIDFETLTTIIRANRGDWVDLGGIMGQKDDVSRTILNWQTSHQSLNNQLLIRVD